MNKRPVALLIIVIMLISLASCSDGGYSYCELSIPLDDGFVAVETEDFDRAFSDGEAVVAILRISFAAANKEGFGEVMTPLEFGRFWTKRCGREADVQNEGGVFFASYYNGGTTGEDFYLEAFYRSKNAYFVVLFATTKSNEDEARVKFLDYASKVYFTE